MSAREWRQGDVAIRTTSPHMSFRDECRTIAVHCYDDSHGPDLHWHHDHGGWDSIPDGDLYEPTYRPLVVIDPEDLRELSRLERLIDSWSGRVPYSDMAESGDLTPVTALQAALREFANPTPPKPDEPTGLGAVVEDAEGERWVRMSPRIADFDWFNAVDHSRTRPWRTLNAVKVLSAGVES